MENPSPAPPAKAKSVYQRICGTFDRVGRVLQIVFSFVFVLVIAGIVMYFAFFTNWAPIVFFVLLWFFCFVLFLADSPPLEKTRVAIALLIAWIADSFLYAVAVGHSNFRHFVPAIVVVSLYLGYIAWRLTSKYANPRESREGSHPEFSNPLAAVAGAMLAIFLMLYVVSPAMNHYFPSYWHSVTNWHLDDDSGSCGPNC